jgi:hypothetical protein
VVSRANGPTGTIANGDGFGISGDGNSVVFSSPSPLDPDADNGLPHLYVRNIAAQTTTLVDRDTGARGLEAEDEPTAAAIDQNGNRVAWSTDAALPGSGTSFAELDRVYVRDLQAGTTTFVSRADGANGAEPNSGSFNPSIDAAGDTVAFESAATNLGVPITSSQVWVRRLTTGRTILASRANGVAGAPADNESLAPSLDAAGDRVAFMSRASNLGAGAPTGISDIEAYLRSLSSNSTTVVSRANGASGAPDDSPGFGSVSLSPNGSCAVFSSTGLNLGDGFPSVDFFAVRERVLRGTCPVSP